MQTFNFATAMQNLGNGNRVTRTAWRAAQMNQQVCLDPGDTGHALQDARLLTATGLSPGTRVIEERQLLLVRGANDGVSIGCYYPSNEDLFALDWQIAEGIVTQLPERAGTARGV